MKKLFISNPMNGKTDEQILAIRQTAVEDAKKYFPGEEVEVIDSFFQEYSPEKGCVPLKYLAKSIELLANADVAYFAADWENARGCRIEHACALSYGIPVIGAIKTC